MTPEIQTEEINIRLVEIERTRKEGEKSRRVKKLRLREEIK
jgi:hypothetical protein